MTDRLMLFLVVIGLLAACSLENPAVAPTPTPSIPFETLVPPETIRALDDPDTVAASEAAEYVAPLEPVLGLAINGEARAYPLGMMGRHEIVNDTVGGKPVAVTYCTHCLTGVALARVVEAPDGSPVELTFGVSGKLLDGALVMIDRQTGSLWPQSRTKAVSGEMAGVELEAIVSHQMPWRDWVAAHPETRLVIDGQTRRAGRGFSLPIRPGAEEEPAQPAVQSYVLGVASDRAALALPLKDVEAVGVVNEAVAGLPPLVVVSPPGPEVARGWQREVDGRVLTFYRDGERLRDEETGSEWDPGTGVARSGPLAGTQLEAVPLEIMHWLGWKDLYPDSAVWRPDAESDEPSSPAP